MDVNDALELLGPSFTHPAVRYYAVARLKQAPDEDLFLYLLQLVQALKYENLDVIHEIDFSESRELQIVSEEGKVLTTNKEKDLEHSSSSSSNLGRASPTGNLADAASKGHSSSDVSLASNLSAIVGAMASDIGAAMISTKKGDIELNEEKPDLAAFLIHRACENIMLANYFYWYLLVECEDHDVGVKQDPRVREMYLAVMRRFLTCMKNGKPEWQERRAIISRQQKFIAKLVEVVKAVAKESANRQKKMEKLQLLLKDDNTLKTNFAKLDPLPFPLDPDVRITGILSQEAILFKSSQMPCRLTFSTESGEPYIAIFKHGDDLRQDQLILQIITLMDKLLRKENLDLKLTPYRVLATSTTHGMLIFICLFFLLIERFF